ncbi:osteoclast-stimulating factor 1-like [Ptychodera flava]|uniref:osteoclast-stimulating factor 1-like n=1 Tax=Ptychodera flava TaxID=63121 RepID=UPI00396A6D16
MSRPAPPKPAPKPGLVKVFQAMYKYDAQQADELSFDEGDMLYVLDMSNSDWWKAKCGGRTGLIPSNYVEESAEAVDNPLHEAAKRGNLSFMNECLNNGVSVNGLDKAGCTALHWAAHGGHIDCVKTLLSVPRIQINVQNKMGDTALHSAAWKGHAEAVRLLLEKGIKTDLKKHDKKMAYDMAKDPSTAALLKHTKMPQRISMDYGDEEDSD